MNRKPFAVGIVVGLVVGACLTLIGYKPTKPTQTPPVPEQVSFYRGTGEDAKMFTVTRSGTNADKMDPPKPDEFSVALFYLSADGTVARYVVYTGR